jgi:hypothetical protein
VAIAASVLIAVWLGIRSPQQGSLELLCHAAIEDFNQGAHQGGQLLTADHLPSEFLPRQGLRIQSRPVRGMLQYNGVAYDVVGPAGLAATLYVLDDAQQNSARNQPPTNPYDSGGCTAAAWRESGRLYVLVVNGDANAYRWWFISATSPDYA